MYQTAWHLINVSTTSHFGERCSSRCRFTLRFAGGEHGAFLRLD